MTFDLDIRQVVHLVPVSVSWIGHRSEFKVTGGRMLLQWSVLLRVETLLVLLSLLLMFITGPPTSCRGPVLCYCSLASVVVVCRRL